MHVVDAAGLVTIFAFKTFDQVYLNGLLLTVNISRAATNTLNTKGKAKITEAHKPVTARVRDRVVADFHSLSSKKSKYD
jgi:hypothetical protein